MGGHTGEAEWATASATRIQTGRRAHPNLIGAQLLPGAPC